MFENNADEEGIRRFDVPVLSETADKAELQIKAFVDIAEPKTPINCVVAWKIPAVGGPKRPVFGDLCKEHFNLEYFENFSLQSHKQRFERE